MHLCCWQDLINDCADKKKRQLQLVTPTFAEFNLQINNTKTEHTVLKRSDKKNEDWRSTKKLGSLKGDQEDILRRKQLSTTALYNLNNIWIRKTRIRERIRLKLYKTIVKPVLIYNSQTWGLTVNDKHNLDSFHRQQLRTALHIKFPHVISNSDLYQRTNEIPLTLTILKNRWKLLGHILRLHPQTPAQQSMRHYFSPCQNSSFRGR